MATKTTNYNLVKPAGKEKVSIDVLNGNMDVIDQAMKGLDDRTVTVANNLTTDEEGHALDAVQGKVLANRVEEVNSSLNAKENLIKNVSSKTTLVDADTLPLSDSATSNSTKKITFSNLKALLASLFLPLTGGTLTGDITLVGTIQKTIAITRSDLSASATYYCSGGGNAVMQTYVDSNNWASFYVAKPDGVDALTITRRLNGVSTNTKLYHSGNVTKGTAVPSGGSDGDIYLQYT